MKGRRDGGRVGGRDYKEAGEIGAMDMFIILIDYDGNFMSIYMCENLSSCLT